MMEPQQQETPDWASRVLVNKKIFGIFEHHHDRVEELKVVLDAATEAKKVAQRNYDTAVDDFKRAADRVINDANGRPDLPLFANMTDAIDAATKNPIVDQLFQRLIDHEIAHLNILIVAGWTDEEQAQVIAYLDSIDARKAFDAGAPHEEGAIVPDVLAMPAFLVPQSDEPEQVEPAADGSNAPSDEMIAEALKTCAIELTTKQISWMTHAQRYAVMTWAARVTHITAEKGEALTAEDLPPAPSFVTNPAELDPKAQFKAGKNAPSDQPKKKRGRKGNGKK